MSRDKIIQVIIDEGDLVWGEGAGGANKTDAGARSSAARVSTKREATPPPDESACVALVGPPNNVGWSFDELSATETL